MFSINRQRNLLHWFKKKSISAEKLNKYLELNPQTDRNLGALPYDWLKSFEPQQRAQITRQVQDTFVSFADETANAQGISRITGWSYVNPDDFKNAYSILVQNLQKILRRNDIKIRYAGSGALKNCHKLQVGEYSYALSAFRDPNVTKLGFGDYFKRGQGRGYEPQNAVTAYRKGAHGRFTKPFSVKISSKEEDNGGYILSKFVDKQAKAPLGAMQESRGYFLNLDRADDTINNINTDIGGCVVNRRHILDKHLRHDWDYFAKMFDINSARLTNIDDRKVHSYLVQQRNKGVDLLAEDYVNQLPFSGNEKDCALKFLRSLRKVHSLKEKLIKEERFDLVKSLLEEDFEHVYKYVKGMCVTESLKKLNTFPKLFADELGLSYETVLENRINMFMEFGLDDISFKKYHSKEEILKLLNKNYDIYRNDDCLINKLVREYKIEKEVEKFEKSYLQSDLGKAETGWESFYAYMKS